VIEVPGGTEKFSFLKMSTPYARTKRLWPFHDLGHQEPGWVASMEDCSQEAVVPCLNLESLLGLKNTAHG
jgi:hypothetical protein